MRTRRLVFGLFLSYFCAAAAFSQNADSKPKQPVATIGGEAIYDEDLSHTIQGQLLPLRNQEYKIKKQALHKLNRTEAARSYAELAMPHDLDFNVVILLL